MSNMQEHLSAACGNQITLKKRKLSEHRCLTFLLNDGLVGQHVLLLPTWRHRGRLVSASGAQTGVRCDEGEEEERRRRGGRMGSTEVG